MISKNLHVNDLSVEGDDGDVGISLRGGESDCVQDQISVAGGIDDGEDADSALKLLEGDIDGVIMVLNSLQLVDNPSNDKIVNDINIDFDELVDNDENEMIRTTNTPSPKMAYSQQVAIVSESLTVGGRLGSADTCKAKEPVYSYELTLDQQMDKHGDEQINLRRGSVLDDQCLQEIIGSCSETGEKQVSLAEGLA